MKSFSRLLLLGVVLAFLFSCEKKPPSMGNDARKKLIGTWISEIEQEGERSRSITELAEDGSFRENEKLTNSLGEAKEVRHAGDWSFDGVNLKRKYTSLDGRPLANAKFGYVTYAVKMSEGNEFIGVDNIRQTTIRFSRMAPNN